jgi:predicted CoA-binding protein
MAAADEAVRLAGAARVVAVLGIKPESHASQPAHFVPSFLAERGVEVIPVPTLYPAVTETILGAPVVSDLKEIRRRVDILDVFRRPADLASHLPDILAMEPRPNCVWLQTGIRDAAFEAAIAAAGIPLVVDRCLKVDRAAAEAAAAPRRSAL